MGKLYIFCIGGSGARVLRSLVMMLASGLDLGVESIVPIIIDPDKSNGDLTRTVSLVNKYCTIQSRLSGDTKNRFFKTKIEDVVDGFIMPLNSETQDLSFKQYIGMPQMKNESGHNNANFALTSALFSQKNLDATMTVGFKGNPNIGSVVLNQFEDSSEFKKFAGSFTSSDKIFIVNSIFGGTGASGFPLLLKNLRQLSDVQYQNSSHIKESLIGNLTLLPYFQLEQPGDSDLSTIDSSTFISKTKAALAYYRDNIIDNKAINSLYFLADRYSSGNAYKNSDGGIHQKNKSHFIELIGALSIKDFVVDSTRLDFSSVVIKEFGFKDDLNQSKLTFESFYDPTNNNIKNNIISLYIYRLYMQNKENYLNVKKTWKSDLNIDDVFLSGSYVNCLNDFLQEFTDWLADMASNSRSFNPVNLVNTDSDIFDFVIGQKVASEFSLEKIRRIRNHSYIDHHLNKASANCNESNSIEQKFFNVFSLAINEIIDKKYR